MKKKDDKDKGQTDISCFFLTKKKELQRKKKSKGNESNSNANADEAEITAAADSVTTTNKENENVNNVNMVGLDSNLRKSAIQKSKEFGTTVAKKTNSQRTINGGVAEGRCDEGTKVCRACEKLKKNPNFKSFAHDPTCKKNSNYKFTDGGRISMQQYYLNKAEDERMKQLKKPFAGKELCSGGHTQDELEEFFTPRTATASSSGVKTVDSNSVDSDSILLEYEISNLVDRIRYHMKHPNYCMRKASTVPMVVAAGIQTLLDLIPVRFKKGTNEVSANDKRNVTYKKLQAYRKKFPPGSIGFTFPRADKSVPPDHYYCQLEGRTIYFVCWELNVPGWEPTCYKCGQVMIHDQYDFQQHGYATPIFDICGTTDYACSMYYNCKKCDNRCKANDGRIFFQLDVQYRNAAYPVDPRYAINKETHLSKAFTRVMDKMFITHGNGDQLSVMLNELRGDRYLDMEEEYFCQAIRTGTKVAAALPSFSYFIGRYSPTGCDLRNLKNLAAESDLLSTRVSDRDRVRREMQGVGCRLTSASDHTFEFRKNYATGLLPENACGHTIGSDTGEIASLVIVQDTKQTEFAHQAEQVTLRPNWTPKVHTTDNCPAGIALWKTLVRGVHCQLGLFHFTYRITKTLNKECKLWRGAVASLQGCMYYYEEKDLENVKAALTAGVIGKVNGEPCPKDQVDSKAKSYRENIRIWTYDSGTIYSRLAEWCFANRDDCDERGEYLFSKDTTKTVMEQMKKTKWVVDTLSKDDLYLEVEATKYSRTGLKSYIGARGTESKLEKGHHAIAHFANGGMRHTLADFLGMGGLALYNLKIRYRLSIAKMKPHARAKIPVGFQRSPHFTNHLRLSHNNKLAQKAGIDDVHSNVEILQPDNGERFFYEGYLQQRKREEDGIQYDTVNNRCLCRDCGRNNPYRKRKPEWQEQQDIEAAPPPIEPTPVQQAPPLPIQPALMPLPLSLQTLPSHPIPITMPPTLPTTMPQTQVLPYSAIVSAGKKNKRRNKTPKRKVD